MNSLLVTTINKLSDDFLTLWKQLGLDYIIVIGDKKTPSHVLEEQHLFCDVNAQSNLGFAVCDKLPFNHYARKNIGYLLALKNGDEFVFETDDDNFIDGSVDSNSIFKNKDEVELVSKKGYENVYKHFVDEEIWPRGFPTDLIKNNAASTTEVKQRSSVKIGVSQGLVNNDPDVDAIYRMVNETGTTFATNKNVVLDEFCYCPFNSQSTLWKREYLPYAYLPSTVSVRYTDILRGFVAQRCLWQHQAKLEFTSPNLIQYRNDHNLLVDLKHEMEMFETVHLLTQTLNDTILGEDKCDNLLAVYTNLAKVGIVQDAELPIVEAWIHDVRKFL